MKVLLTGATSGLGRNAAEWLLNAGYKVHATGRNSTVGNQLRNQGAEFTAIDLTQATAQECERLMLDCDVVWHCAAKSSPWGSKAEFDEANVTATEKLAEAAGRCGISRFVHISTPAIYFDFQNHECIDEQYRAQRFANHYASSKYLAEQSIQTLVKRYPQTTFIILRPRGLFGPHDRVILPRILGQIERDRGVLRLPGGGQAMLDLTFVLNVVHAMDLASHNSSLVSGAAYNVTNHQPMRLVDTLRLLLHDQLALRYHVQPMPYRLLHTLATALELLACVTRKEPMLTRYSVAAVNFDMTLSQTRAINELGYRPLYSMEEGIQLTGQFLRSEAAQTHG
ncbi:NAD(P)-dependent oxidoreductase [Pseudomonas avellanae]|uniref:NAD(P)-dependent oxidoreductase n=2 Tax=Pseudomonas syringae group TaxID=136849 RepID=A0A261WPA4_9PSED|nr:NAD(P)-dependent oxidoreductase [Pseudomonas syringae]OZI88024.1 NAD(P)-dependent oxidoreductase [Pseudomonas avellanae]ATV15630.1 NAD(P)-dependent oxidoreductase [Pseudomonas syringae pv. actinidiae]EPM52024.1 NAD-dependent epimerase/dehydratase [Pseudomonas syringae pv. actinidiae ICMP 19073]NYS40144.1 NAD(P)-dependent oxidoreductase [Pseudomonas syringae pv. actinidiae]PIN58692.1 NAD(P)-dependent oxidoreductase [Pseudomonas syringae pv. actinidiae]